MPRAGSIHTSKRLKSGRSSRRTAFISASIVVAIAVACLGTLPYTLGTDGESSNAPRRIEATDLSKSLLPPFWAPHNEVERAQIASIKAETGSTPRPIFGTDKLGRDVFIRSLAGGGISLVVGLSAAALAILVGTLYGSLAAGLGGRWDGLLMRTVDVLYGLPYILLVVLIGLAVDGIFQRQGTTISPGARQWVNVLTLWIAIGSVSWLTIARVIRGQVLSLKAQPFMEATRAVGVPVRRQFVVHLLPNLLGPIIVYATLTVPMAILSESFLSFLGIGVREPLPSWGNMAASGLSELNVVRVRWWLILWPCLLIGVTLLTLNFLGEALRDVFDPRRRSQ